MTNQRAAKVGDKLRILPRNYYWAAPLHAGDIVTVNEIVKEYKVEAEGPTLRVTAKNGGSWLIRDCYEIITPSIFKIGNYVKSKYSGATYQVMDECLDNFPFSTQSTFTLRHRSGGEIVVQNEENFTLLRRQFSLVKYIEYHVQNFGEAKALKCLQGDMGWVSESIGKTSKESNYVFMDEWMELVEVKE